MNTLNICAISDLHGYLPDNIRNSDLLVIAGDVVPLDIQTNMQASKEWFATVFNNWVDNLPVKDVIMIAGNHDFALERNVITSEEGISEITSVLTSKCCYLKDEIIEYEGKHIYGTPWCHLFGRWAFMTSDNSLEIIFKKIPENLDLLITHDAPYGCTDICLQDVSWNKHEHIGSKPLREAILEKNPLKVVHGHLHSTSHDWDTLGNSLVRNVSLVDEHYKPVYDPTYFTI